MNGRGLVTKSCPTLVTPWTVACKASQARILEWVAFSFSIYMYISVYTHTHTHTHIYIKHYVHVYVHVSESLYCIPETK